MSETNVDVDCDAAALELCAEIRRGYHTGDNDDAVVAAAVRWAVSRCKWCRIEVPFDAGKKCHVTRTNNVPLPCTWR